MKATRWLLLVLLVMFGSCGYKFLSGLRTDVYYGRVVDEQDGVPLVGASVTVIWYKTPPIQMDRTQSFLSAQEIVTGPDGSFSLEVSPGLDWDPLTVRIGEPQIVIYSVGYEPNSPEWMVRWGFNTFDSLVVALKSGTTIKLRKLKNTKADVQRYTSFASLNIANIPLEKIPKLTQAINTQSKLAGIESYSEPAQKGKLP